uniref:Uncharacterized protein n=1 Tax=Arundo donax TaxID=35708 RepID=A0A0A9AC44_ARUDO
MWSMHLFGYNVPKSHQAAHKQQQRQSRDVYLPSFPFSNANY